MLERAWLKHYDACVSHTLWPYPNKTLFEVLAESARQRPGYPALIFNGAQMSYEQLEHLSNAFAHSLMDLNVKKGDRVALLLPNSPQFLICQLGAWKIGAIVSPLNPAYNEHELEHSLVEIGAETAVVLTPFYNKLKRLQKSTALHRIVATNIKEYLPRSSRLLFTLFREKKDGHRIKLQHGDKWLQSMLRPYKRSTRPDVLVSPDDPALLMFTGGTTGQPKAALSSHQALLISGMQLHAWMTAVREDWVDVTMLLMPMFHTYGNVGVFSAAVVARNTMVPIADPRDLDAVVSTIDRIRPAYLCGVPTLFTALLRHPDVKKGRVDFTSIKLCLCGAAALMTETKQRFEKLTQGRIVEGYALTESVMATVMTPVQGAYKPGAVGIPLPDVLVRIVDPQNGNIELPPGEIGEILLSGPQLMIGYWQRPEETSEMIRGGWLFTGDLGYLDEDGYLFLVDRAKDVIKPSGFQVWPREVEEVLASHPAVSEVGVAGIPDPLRGEAVKAWVVLGSQQKATVSELRAYCRHRLTAYKVPRKIEFRDSLPKSSVGKVLRRELVAQEQNDRLIPSSSK